MGERVLKTRVKLKRDTYENWVRSNPVLLEGEVATAIVTNSSVTPPLAMSMTKTGDGASHFIDLPWDYAFAGDVHEWAKQEKKPTYTADEIQGLKQAISSAIEESLSGEGEESEPIIGLVYAYGSFYDQIGYETGGLWLQYWIKIVNNSPYRVRAFWQSEGESSHVDLDAGESSGQISIGGSSSPSVNITQVIRLA